MVLSSVFAGSMKSVLLTCTETSAKALWVTLPRGMGCSSALIRSSISLLSDGVVKAAPAFRAGAPKGVLDFSLAFVAGLPVVPPPLLLGASLPV